MSPRLPVAPRFCPQAHLLRTTALASLLPLLALSQPALAEYQLDNEDPSNAPIRADSGTWTATNLIWHNTDTGQASALANGGVAVLGQKVGTTATLTIDNTDGVIRVDTIQVNEDGYTLTGGTLNGTGLGLRFATDNPNTPVTIDVSTRLNASVIVQDGVTLNYSGVTSSAASLLVETGAVLNTSAAATTLGELTVNGTALLAGTHTGTINNTGEVELASGSVSGQFTNLGDAEQTGAGLAAGLVNGDAGTTGTADYVLRQGSITGPVINNADFRQRNGTIAGDIENNNYVEITGGEITGDVANNADATLDLVGGTINGNVVNNADFQQLDGTITGAVVNSDELTLSGGEIIGEVTNNANATLVQNSGIITGNVTNHGIMAGYSTVKGMLTNSAAANLYTQNNGTLIVEDTIVNRGTVHLAYGSTVTADIESGAGSTLVIYDTTLNGNVRNRGSARLEYTGAEIFGDFNNDEHNGAVGQLASYDNDDIRLDIHGRLTSEGSIFTAAAGDLLIVADEILLLDRDRVENDGSVVLQGTEVVQDQLTFSTDERLSEGLIDGGLLNEATGTVTIEAGAYVEGNDYSVNNMGRFEIRGGNSGIYALEAFDNTGADAQLIVDIRSFVRAATMANSGTVTNGGAISAAFTNETGGTLTNTGRVAGDITNAAGATLISSNLIDGDVDNDGTANLAGTITGELDNSTADLTLTGDLTVGSLNNNGSNASMNVSKDQTLTATNGIVNSGALTVTGTVIGSISNSLTLNNSGTITGYVHNRSGATITSSTLIDGYLNNDGTANLAGEITGELDNSTADVTLTGNLTVGSLTNEGSNATITVANGQRLTATNGASNGGTLNIAGTFRGDVENAGTLRNSGVLTGNVDNRSGATLTSSNTITGNVENDGTANLAGTITGELDNSTADLTLTGDLEVGSLKNTGSGSVISVGADQTLTSNGTVDNEGTLTVGLDGALVADGDITNSRTMTVTGSAETKGDVTNTGTLDVGGMLAADGDITNEASMTVSGGVTAGGDVTNNSTLDVDGNLAAEGAVSNNGTLDIAGSLAAEDGVTNNDVMNVAGSIAGDVTNTDNAEMNLTSGSITGNVSNEGQTNISGAASIIGNLTNTGTMTAMGGTTTLSVTGGTFLNDGTLNARPSSTLRITADALEFGQNSVVDGSRVILEGDIINRGDLRYEEDAALREGGLINTSTGTTTVSAVLDADGNNITNSGIFTVTTDPDSTGNLRNVGVLENNGTFTIDGPARVTAITAKNTGGTMTIAGRLFAPLSNDAGAEVVLDGGTITGAVSNSGTLNGRGTINGALTNRGTALLAGAAGDTANSGTLTTGGDLDLAGLTNTGTTNVSANDTLTVADTVDNQRKLNIDGTLQADLNNAENASTQLRGGTINGAVSNLGNLAGYGTIIGKLTNDNTAALSGTLSDTVNNGTLTTAGNLYVTDLTNNGRVEILDGDTLNSPNLLNNNKDLIVAGMLTGSVQNAASSEMTVNGGTIDGTVTNLAGSTTTLNDGTIEGYLNNAGTLLGNGKITGTLQNTGTTRVATGQELTTGGTVNTKTLTVAGTLTGDVDNRSTGTTTLQSGTIDGALVNAGIVSGNGRVTGQVTNNGTLNTAGTLRVGGLSNTNTVNIATQTTLRTDTAMRNSAALNVAGTLNGALNNHSIGTVTLNSGKITGLTTNTGTITGQGTLSAGLINNGVANIGGTAGAVTNKKTLGILGGLTVKDLTNTSTGKINIQTDDVLTSKNRVSNAGEMTIAGVMNGALGNSSDVLLSGGTINGAVTNGNNATLNGNGTIDGKLSNSGDANLRGSIGQVDNSGILTTRGTLNVAGLTNTGTVGIGADEALISDTVVSNARTLKVTGNLQGGLANRAGATTTLTDGTLTGPVGNSGTLKGTGTVDGNLITKLGGSTQMGGTVTGDLINRGGVITPAGDLRVEGKILNAASDALVLSQNARSMAMAAAATPAATPGTFTIGTGMNVTAMNGTTNGPGATLIVDGTLTSDVINNGIYRQTGNLAGSLATRGDAQIGGTVSGNVDFNGGKMALTNGLAIDGTLSLNKDYTLANGSRFSAAETVIAKSTTMRLGDSDAKAGSAAERAQIKGNLVNNGTINLKDNRTGDVLTVGGLSGNGTAAFDIRTGETLSSDKIVVDGGRTTGNLYVSLNNLDDKTGSTVGKRVTLVDVDDSYGSRNDFKYSADNLGPANERIVYSIDQASANGDLTLVSQVNPAIGAMFANVTLVQSLIGSVINRPTSPYVTGLVVDSAEKPCGIGGWGRATGGSADVEGKTNNQVSTLENKVSADYYGMQGGMDLACFDDRFNGWDMAFGALGGVNIGDSTQPIYAINGYDSQATTGALASITKTDFQQRYFGVYATASKDRWVADLQLRMEKTDFELKNTPVSGNGLGITDPDFSSDGYTLSGSLSYSMPIAKSGWNFTPTMGFAWSKYSTDSIRFDDGFWMEFDDSERKVGFVGATVSKAFVRMEENAAIQTFATATYYKDFADDAVSRLYNDELEGFESQVMTSENLKSFGEVSVGANYVKVLNPGQAGGARQFSTSARIDGRFGDTIDSVGVTGQIRWQF